MPALPVLLLILGTLFAPRINELFLVSIRRGAGARSTKGTWRRRLRTATPASGSAGPGSLGCSCSAD